MKKTLTVNISGVVFSIDEDAYQMLESYLADIESRLNAQNEDSETIRDIESRIMEIFKESEKNSYFVVSIDLVKRVIATIGSPSIFGDPSQEPKQWQWQRQWQNYNSSPNRLMRNPIDKVFGGVCSGLASYLKIDTTILRTVLAIVTFFTGGGFAIAYLILWIVIPEARTKEEIASLNRK